MDPSKALYIALMRIALLIQLAYYRSILAMVKYLRDHKKTFYVFYVISEIGPYLLFGMLLLLLAIQLAKWLGGA